MITEWFVAFVVGLVGALADWLPEWEFPSAIEGALSAVLTMDSVVPASEFIAVAVMVLGLSALLFMYRLIKILVAHVPLFGGTG